MEDDKQTLELPTNYSNFTVNADDTVEFDELDDDGKIVAHRKWSIGDDGRYSISVEQSG